MEDKNFHSSDFYEKYVLGHLQEEEESQFEEHLLFCDHCREQLKITEAIILSSKKQPEKKSFSVQRRIITSFIIAAATVLLLLGLNYLFLEVSDNIKKETSTTEESLTDTIADKTLTHKIIADNEVIKKDTIPERILADVFQPLPVFENAIKNYSRSETIEIISPKMSAVITPIDTLIFKWADNQEVLTLVIFDNKGQIISENKVTSPFICKKPLPIGLYYWQLENDEEALFTSKFSVRQ